MIKKNSLGISLLLGLLICMAVLSACNGDDDNGIENEVSGGGKEKTVPKRIVKVIKEDKEYETFTISNISYDSLGRVAKVVIDDEEETTYEYEEGTIIVKSKEYHFNWNLTSVYTLSNGLIVEESYSENSNSYHWTGNCFYTYDDNGYLTSVEKYYGGGKITKKIEWSNGNVTKILITEVDSYSTFSYEYSPSYSNISWSDGIPIRFDFSSQYKVWLIAMGYFGKRPKCLVSELIEVHNQKPYKKYFYEYTLTEGFVTERKRFMHCYNENGELNLEQPSTFQDYKFIWQ